MFGYGEQEEGSSRKTLMYKIGHWEDGGAISWHKMEHRRSRFKSAVDEFSLFILSFIYLWSFQVKMYYRLLEK